MLCRRFPFLNNQKNEVNTNKRTNKNKNDDKETARQRQRTELIGLTHCGPGAPGREMTDPYEPYQKRIERERREKKEAKLLKKRTYDEAKRACDEEKENKRQKDTWRYAASLVAFDLGLTEVAVEPNSKEIAAGDLIGLLPHHPTRRSLPGTSLANNLLYPHQRDHATQTLQHDNSAAPPRTTPEAATITAVTPVQPHLSGEQRRKERVVMAGLWSLILTALSFEDSYLRLRYANRALRAMLRLLLWAVSQSSVAEAAATQGEDSLVRALVAGHVVDDITAAYEEAKSAFAKGPFSKTDVQRAGILLVAARQAIRKASVLGDLLRLDSRFSVSGHSSHHCQCLHPLLRPRTALILNLLNLHPPPSPAPPQSTSPKTLTNLFKLQPRRSRWHSTNFAPSAWGR